MGTKGDEQVLEPGAEAAVAASSKPSGDVLNERLRWLELLKAFYDTLQDLPGIKEILQKVHEMFPSYLGVNRACLFLYDEDLQALVSHDALARGLQGPELVAAAQPVSYSISGMCFAQARPIVIQDCSGSDLIPAEYVSALNLKSTVAVPVIAKHKVLGVLRVDDTERVNRFTAEDVEFLLVVAEQLAVVIENARLIGERRTAEQALREGERRYRLLLEEASDAILVLRPDGGIVTANSRACEMFGYSQQELLSLSARELAYRASEPGVPFDPLNLVSGPPGLAECRLKHRTGSAIHAEITARTTEDGCVQAILRDVTARKEAEHERGVYSKLGLGLAGADTLEKIAVILSSVIGELVDCQKLVFSVVRSGQTRFRVVAGIPIAGTQSEDFAPQEFVVSGKGVLAPLLRGETVVIGDLHVHAQGHFPMFLHDEDAAGSVLCVPVRLGRKVVGILSLYSSVQDGFAARDCELLMRIADAAGPAVERCRAEKRSTAFSSLGQRLILAANPRAAAEIIVAVADDLLGWDACSVDLYSPSENRMYPALHMDIVDGRRADVPISNEDALPTAIGRLTITEGAQLILRDENSISDLPLRPFGDQSRLSRSLIFVPIRSNAGTIGVLSIQSYTPKAYDRDDLEILQALADHCSGALERTRVRRELQQSETRFRTVVESLGEGVVITDMTDKIVYVNSRMAEISGYPAEELVGRNCCDVLFPADLWPAISEWRSERVAEGADDCYEIQLMRKCGPRFWAEVKATPYRDSRGEIAGTLAAVTDISDRMRAEREREVFSRLGLQLAGVDSLHKTGNVVRAITEELWAWDAFLLSVRQAGEAVFRTIVAVDTIDGEKRLLPQSEYSAATHLHLKTVLVGIALLTNRTVEDPGPTLPRFGDVSRPSASLLHVPVRVGLNVVGILSIQSYTPYFFDEHDRDLLQRVADAIGPALEHCRAEAALRESEEKYRLVVESVNDGIAISQERKFIFLNRRFAEMLGFTQGELLMKSFRDICTADGLQIVEKRRELRRMGQAVPERYETIFRTKGGDELHVEASVSTIHYLGKPATFGVFRDIMERKRAEQTLARLAAAIEQSSEAIVITDTDWTIQYVNPAFEKITGYSCEEAIGQRPRALLDSGMHDDAYYESLKRKLADGQVWSGQFINRRKDGTTYEEETVISPIRDASGRVINYVTAKHDVTQQRALEVQLRQSQKMEAIGLLAGGIAHDFNNLLVAIMGYSELVLSSVPPGDPMKADVEEILKASERAASLTRQLLAFSRRQVLQPQILDLNEVVMSVDKLLRRLIGENIRLVTIPASNLGLVNADPGQIEQVIINVAINARDAMASGGKLTIETSNAAFDETYASRHVALKPGPYVMLAISDTGHGMDSPTLARIFEPFFTTKSLGQGTGLGLATVYGIVKQTGGEILVSSELGKGTTFKICLPRIDNPQETEDSAASRARDSMGSETILVVEDEEVIRTLARRVLEKQGYRVLEACDGSEALALTEQHRGNIDLLVSDVVMPGLSGRELAEKLKSFRPALKTLFVSGYTDDAIVRHGVLEPGTAFLQKPFMPDSLVHKVREVLDDA